MPGFDPLEELRKAGVWYPPSDWGWPGRAADRVMAALAEGFCPRCGGALLADPALWCPYCQLAWERLDDGWSCTRGGAGLGSVTWQAHLRRSMPEWDHIRIPEET